MVLVTGTVNPVHTWLARGADGFRALVGACLMDMNYKKISSKPGCTLYHLIIRVRLLLTVPNVIEVVVGDSVGPSVRATHKEEGGGDDDGGELHFEDELSGYGNRSVGF